MLVVHSCKPPVRLFPHRMQGELSKVIYEFGNELGAGSRVITRETAIFYHQDSIATCSGQFVPFVYTLMATRNNKSFHSSFSAAQIIDRIEETYGIL